MILLDPDLEPDAVPQTKRTRQAGARETRTSERNDRLPTARTLERFLRTAQATVRLRGAVTALLTTDRGIRRLNREFRGKDKATDVLSFPAAEMAGDEAGDLAISVETARKQAFEQGHALGTELKVLMLHGLLHLAGYDHETDEGQMARRERALRAKLRLPLGLIERVESREAKPAKKTRQ
ncbi:MAG: rRNA maturation RNase YbeY, partial [Terracidiphilus sp.]